VIIISLGVVDLAAGFKPPPVIVETLGEECCLGVPGDERDDRLFPPFSDSFCLLLELLLEEGFALATGDPGVII